MGNDILNKFNEKFFHLEFDTVREWAKIHPDIGNVLRRLCTECFALIADFNQSDEISFIYIYSSVDNPGSAITLRFRENNFYDYLLMFSLNMTKTNKDLEMFGVYNTFIHHLRTFLEANDILTINSHELQRMRNGTFIGAQLIEIIKTYSKSSKIAYYRKCFGEENYKDLEKECQYVYIMMNIDEFTFKIGQSKNPKYREGTLQSKEPNIFLLKAWKCDKKIEKDLHKIYHKNRVRGEWFKFYFGELLELNIVINGMIKH